MIWMQSLHRHCRKVKKYCDHSDHGMRLALVEAMYEEQKPFLILDDPFVNLDENRTKGAMRFLTEIAKEYQVIYFTCHGSRG